MSETHEYIKCSKCQGIKEYMGMGLIMHDCHVCEKVGYVKRPIDDIAILAEKQLANTQEKIVDHQSEDKEVLRETIIVERKKPGRKPKVS